MFKERFPHTTEFRCRIPTAATVFALYMLPAKKGVAGTIEQHFALRCCSKIDAHFKHTHSPIPSPTNTKTTRNHNNNNLLNTAFCTLSFGANHLKAFNTP